MKKILITGKNSYIGTSFEKWLAKEPDKYQVDTVGTRNGEWKELDFSVYDVVYHVAGIAHNSSDPKLKDLYYTVNRDLTIEIARKAKDEGVSQFIFMSSIIVYGTKNEIIDENTIPKPDNFYGDSKLQAENGLETMEEEKFKVAIIRPPMIYGKGSKGNYIKLSKLAQKTPIFPNFDNRRSVLYIDNLCQFICFLVDNEDRGHFFPQNKEFMQTSKIVKYIAEHHNNKILFSKIGNPIIKLLLKQNFTKKIFGDLLYLPSISNYNNGEYQLFSLEESIKLTEGKKK